MADKPNKTTSSTSLDDKNDRKIAPPATPKTGEAQMLTKLSQNLCESYQLVKRRQQKYNQLIKPQIGQEESSTMKLSSTDGEWQEVCSAKNKLKRKKKLSSSLTSVTDSVNQEKRTRIEGIQLNCRGKLTINEASASRSATTLSPATPSQSSTSGTVTKTETLSAKPPLPPLAAKNINANPQCAGAQPVKVPPPRLKRKLQENIQTIQKLNALGEQLRLEINELKSNLTTERGSVRVLRAQNESETRKWKNEVKKLQTAVELLKKNSTCKRPTESTTQTNAEGLPNTSAAGSLVNYEIQRLTNEIIALKEANKALEEKKTINCDADRRKAADMRTLKDSYEIRLTQLTKSAKTEISRLLEEIKTKERSIGQLKKDLQILQNKPQIETTPTKSRNATTNSNHNSTNTTTTNKTTTKQPKKTNRSNSKTKPINEILTTPSTKVEETKDTTNQAQSLNEMKKLKDIELINNTKNLQNNVNLKSTKILTTTINSQNTNQHKLNGKSLETYESHKTIMLNDENFHNNNNNLLKTTTTCGQQQQQQEYHSMPHEFSERLLGTNSKSSKIHHQQQQPHNNVHEYRTKDNNSDSDSALSSAPPSISPQPPPAGLETADIWQMIRTYTTDIEKLQKDIDLLQKENEQLHKELNLAKEHILDTEKSAMEANNSTKLKQLIERIKYLEDQEHQLHAESNELREQNELLEFRILELEENNDKWSLQSNATPSSTSATTSTTIAAASNNVWGCIQPNKDDPMQMLFGSNTNMNMDSGITSPHSQHHHIEEEELNLMDVSNEEMRRRIGNMMKKSMLDDEDRKCLQQVQSLVQQLDLLSQRSGPDSLNTTSSSDEASSLDLVKSRISDYSSASSSSSARSAYDNVYNSKSSKSSAAASAHNSTNSRIVATVQPYNSAPQQQQQQPHHVPTNTPTDSPRKSRQAWQTTSLSESGVFVESDFLSDSSENNVCTQTDFEDDSYSKDLCTELQKLQTSKYTNSYKVPTYSTQAVHTQLSPQHSSEQKRLQYYKERLEVLESKVLIYESSGDLQAKRLADRLQREIQLEKELKELQDRVEFLESENSTLEEEKCEFEEAENDTRLRLQRLEVELEILSQRNIELEMSREALSAKYKECRSECLILRDDISASETQVRHLEEDKQKAKENLEFLHSTLPLLLVYNNLVLASQQKQPQNQQPNQSNLAVVAVGANSDVTDSPNKMGNIQALIPPTDKMAEHPAPIAQLEQVEVLHNSCNQANAKTLSSDHKELQRLRDEVKCLHREIKELNSRHYEALESADCHWVDLERGYKDREEVLRSKELCLKQKINQLQDCLRDDTRAANEKICQMEETEKELKSCLMRLSKEHREVLEEHRQMAADYECCKDQLEQLNKQQNSLNDSLEGEKKRNKNLTDELTFMCKLQQECEAQNVSELESLRTQLLDLKKEFLHIEVTNSELKEEVSTLEKQIISLQSMQKDYEDKMRCLADEVRSKEETCQMLENRLQRSEGFSLAQEMCGSPSKRFKRENVNNLETASKGLASALKNMTECDSMLPSHRQFQSVARDVKKLADKLLQGESNHTTEEPEYVALPKLTLTEITQI